MEFKDYYKVLGVDAKATPDEIKRTYRKLARQFHPDVNKEAGTEERFKEIGEAYDALKDEQRRAAYDELAVAHKAGEAFRPPPGWQPPASPDAGADEQARSEFFESLFRRARAAEGAQRARERAEFHARGEDQHARISISLADSYSGATRTLSLTGAEIGEDGRVVMRERKLNVTVPKGVENGQVIRLKGQGSPGMGRMPAGDLYLEVMLEPDALYRVAGRDVYLDLPVAPWEAALGGKVRMPTPGGPIMLAIPPASFQNRELRVKGRGLPAKEPGDLYAVLKIALPPADTDTAKDAYRDFERKSAFDPRAGWGV